MIEREEGYKYQNTSAVRRERLIGDLDELIRYSKEEGAAEAKIPHQIAKIISDVLVFVGKTPEVDEELEVDISSYLIPWLCDVCPHTIVNGKFDYHPLTCATCGAGELP